jgi:8-oxo-dGTP diphosphatase
VVATQRIGVAMLRWRDRFVLQLRDFKPEINDPGQWGLFGGHLSAAETAADGVRREVHEELGWMPRDLRLFGCFPCGDYSIIAFASQLDVPLEALVLGEGHEFGAFPLDEIRTGRLFSNRCQEYYPVTAATQAAVSLWGSCS